MIQSTCFTEVHPASKKKKKKRKCCLHKDRFFQDPHTHFELLLYTCWSYILRIFALLCGDISSYLADSPDHSPCVCLLVLFLARLAEKVTACAGFVLLSQRRGSVPGGQESCQAHTETAAPLTLSIAFVSLLIKSAQSCCEASLIITKVRIYGAVLESLWERAACALQFLN